MPNGGRERAGKWSGTGLKIQAQSSLLLSLQLPLTTSRPGAHARARRGSAHSPSLSKISQMASFPGQMFVPGTGAVAKGHAESQKACQVAGRFTHPSGNCIFPVPPPSATRRYAVSFDDGRATAGSRRASRSTREEEECLSATEEFEGCCLGSVTGDWIHVLGDHSCP